MIEECQINVNSQDTEGKRTALYRACAFNQLDLVKYLISKCADPEIKQNEGATPLLIACQEGHIEIVRFLIESFGIEIVNKSRKEKKTPFGIAASHNHLEVLKYLISIGCGREENQGEIALRVAVDRSRFEIVKLLVESGFNMHFKSKEHAPSSWQASLRKEDLKVIQFLMENGGHSQKEIPNAGGLTPLLFSIKSGNLKLLEYLVSVGCDLTARSNYGKTAFILACESGNLEILQFLVEKTELALTQIDSPSITWTPVLYAIYKKKFEVVKYLFSIGCDFQKSSKDGLDVALSLAAQSTNVELVKFLIENCKLDSQKEHVNEQGLTPIQIAALYGNSDVLKYLISINCDSTKLSKLEGYNLFQLCVIGNCDIQHLSYLISIGFDPHVKSKEGKTSFYLACEVQNFAALKFLVENCKVELIKNEPNYQKVSPLLISTYHKHIEIVKYLISIGCDINQTDEEENTPLFLASELNSLELVKFFIENGAISHPDMEGVTPIHIASRKGNLEIVKYLVSIGTNFNHEDKGKRTSFWSACSNGHMAVAKFLAAIGADVKAGTPFFNVCQHSHLDVLKFLVEHCKGDSQKEKPDKEGATSLMVACAKGDLRVVKYLVEDLRCNLIQQDRKGKDALWFACSSGKLEVVKYLNSIGLFDLSKSSKVAVEMGHLDIISYFGSLGYKWRDFDLLNIAAGKGHLSIVSYLISMGTPFLKKLDSKGNSALLNAIRNGKLDVAKFLISMGANVNHKNSRDEQALHLASQSGSVDMVKFLIDECGAISQQHSKNSDSQNPIQVAIQCKHLDILKYFISIGIDKNLADDDGRNLFFLACNNPQDQLEIPKYLHSIGCDINGKDMLRKTPFLNCCQEGYLKTLKWLIEIGCDQEIGTEKETAIDIAKQARQDQIVKYLKRLQRSEFQKMKLELCETKKELKETKAILDQILIELKSKHSIEVNEHSNGLSQLEEEQERKLKKQKIM